MDRAIASRAERQHGVISGQQLMRLGVSQKRIDYRVRVGRLVPLHRGVFAVGHACLTHQGACLAAVLAGGKETFADGPSALALWGIRDPGEREPVHVVAKRRIRAPKGVRVRRTDSLAPADTGRRYGVPVLMPGPALLASASVLGPRDLRRAVNEALVRKRVNIPQLIELLAKGTGRRGVARLARVVLDAHPTRSDLEDAAVAFLLAFGLYGFETNARVGPDEVDVLWRAERLVLELDGGAFHDNPLARADDAAKNERLRAAGHWVERLRWPDVTTRQATTAECVRALREERKPE